MSAVYAARSICYSSPRRLRQMVFPKLTFTPLAGVWLAGRYPERTSSAGRLGQALGTFIMACTRQLGVLRVSRQMPCPARVSILGVPPSAWHVVGPHRHVFTVRGSCSSGTSFTFI